MFVCFFLSLKLEGNNSRLHYFSPVPKRFAIFFIYSHFHIVLHFIPLVLLWINFKRSYASCQRAEPFCSALAGFFLGGVQWQWSWTFLRTELRLLEKVLQSVIFMYYINLGVQRCIQSLVKHRRWSIFVKGVNGSWSLTVLPNNLLLGCLSSECTSRVF